MQLISGKSDTECLANISRRLESCTRCTLYKTATRIVPGKLIGNPNTVRVMFIGEGPGADEDRTGLPFVGRAGQLLQRILNDIGLIDNIYITNIMKHRPPNNRKPTIEEMDHCANEALIREIETLRPKKIVCLGRSPAEYMMTLADGGRGIQKAGSLRGLKFNITHDDGWSIPVLCTWHPAFILRRPEKRHELEEDLNLLIT